MKRTLRTGAVALSLAFTLVLLVVGCTLVAEQTRAPPGGEPVIKIVARRFSYTPDRIALKTGQATILEFTSIDYTHGFSVPELHLRADLPPGKVTRVRIVAERAGTFEFACDNFCGSGHEEMSGSIVVSD